MNKYWCWFAGKIFSLMLMLYTFGKGSIWPFPWSQLEAPQFTLGFYWGSCYSIFIFMCMFYRSLFVLLYFFFWAVVLSVLLRYTDSDYLPLLSSNSSCTGFNGKKVRIFFPYEPHMEIHLYVILNIISSILNLT